MHRNSKITFFVLALFVVALNFIFAPGNIISWDVYGYYLYLPTTFIYHDLGILNDGVILDLMEQYKSSATFYQATKVPEGHYVMKYSMGMAILYLPSFLLGWLGSVIFDYRVDGFSLPFQYALFLGSITYSIIGLWFLTRVLDRFFNWKITSLVLALIVLGTNYMVHISMYGQNAMSQNYLFTGYVLVLWLTIKWHEKYKFKYAVGLAIAMGLMALSRPTEIVVLAIPVLWGVSNKETLLKKWGVFRTLKKQVIVTGLIIGGIGFLQLLYWKIYAGKFLFNSYGGNPGEGLELLSPFTKKFLFSFRKGWLIYTPIMTFAIFGFYQVYKRNRAIFYSLVVYFIANLYLVSSWSNWWYAQSFSQRAMVSSYPIMAIGIGYFLVSLKDLKLTQRSLVVSVLAFFLGLNIFQTIQFDKGVIHADRMTAAYYWATFGKLKVTKEDQKLLLINRNYTGTDAFSNEENYNAEILEELTFDEYELGVNGAGAFKLDAAQIYSPSIEKSFKEITGKDHCWFRITTQVFLPDSATVDDFSLVVQFTHKGFAYNYKTVESKNIDIVPGTWNTIKFDYLSPEVRNSKDSFKTFVWYRGKKAILLDDFKVEVFTPK